MSKKNLITCSMNKPFAYVCCDESDLDRAYPIAARLHNEGFNLLLGDAVSSNAAIDRCEYLLFFVSPASVGNDDLINRFVYACAGGKSIIFVHLEPVDRQNVDPAMRGELTINQGIMWSEMAEGERERKLRDSLQKCRGACPLITLRESLSEREKTPSLQELWGSLSPKFRIIAVSAAAVLLILLILLLPSLCTCSPFENHTPAELFEYYEQDGGVVISGYTGSYKKVSIPPKIDGRKVIAIDDDAFYHNSDLHSVTVPEGVVRIGNRSFSHCTDLTTVRLPESVTEIGDDAFEFCLSLSSVNVPSRLVYLGAGAFSGCEALKAVTLPASLTQVNEEAFLGCRSIEEIILHEGLLSLEQYAFAYCDSLRTAECPDSLKSIGDYAFFQCSALSSVRLPSSLEEIASNVFSGCLSLTEITLPDSIRAIGDYAFSGCERLSSLTLPASLETIGSYALRGCKSIRELEIPENVSEVGDMAFASCYSLGKVVFCGDKVTQFGFGTFIDCASLKEIVLPSLLEHLGSGTFAYCSSLYSFTVPDSVTEIGDYVFEGCRSLSSVRIGASVEKIGKNAFSNCGSSLFSGTFGDKTFIEISDFPVTVTAPHKAKYYGCKPADNVEWVVESAE